MSSTLAITGLLSIALTLGLVAWLYPLNAGSVALIFLVSSSVSILLVNTILLLLKKRNELKYPKIEN